MAEPIPTTNIEPVHSQKAILWGQVDVLAQAVSAFLQKSIIWDVIQIQGDEGIEKLIEVTKQVNPDVVILCQEKMGDHASLPIQLIQEQLCLKVVIVGLESNLMQVYSKHNIIFKGDSDFLSIVGTGIFSNCTSGKEVEIRKRV